MSMRIELRVGKRIVDGVDEWWDDMEVLLPTNTAKAYPLLNRVDPYGDVVFEQHDLRRLADELQALNKDAPQRLRLFITKLINLCNSGAVVPSAELRFLGD